MNKDLATTFNQPVVMVLDTTIYDTAISKALPATTGVGGQSLTFIFVRQATSVVTITAGDMADLSDGQTVAAQWLTGDPLSGYAGEGGSRIGYGGQWRYVKINITNPVANTTVFAIADFLSKAPVVSV